MEPRIFTSPPRNTFRLYGVAMTFPSSQSTASALARVNPGVALAGHIHRGGVVIGGVQDVLVPQVPEIAVDHGQEQHLVGGGVFVFPPVVLAEGGGDVVPYQVHGLYRLDVLHVLGLGASVDSGHAVHVHPHLDLIILVDQDELAGAHGRLCVFRLLYGGQVAAHIAGSPPQHIAGRQQARQAGGVLAAPTAPRSSAKVTVLLTKFTTCMQSGDVVS